MSIRRNFARLRTLSPPERRLLARALWLLPAYAAGVRALGLRRARGWFAHLPAIEGATQGQAVRMVAAVARRAPWAGGCLPAALTLQRLLAAQGIGSRLRIGVRKGEGGLEAHAWVEREGVTLFDPGGADQGFAALEGARPAP